MSPPVTIRGRRARRAFLLALSPGAALVVACSRSGEPAAPPAESVSTSVSSQSALGDTVRIVVGRAVSLDGGRVSVGFEALVDESRCPANAICVWQGNAAVRLRVVAANRFITPVLNTSLEPRAVAHGGYTLELVHVEPYPGTVADNVRVAPSVMVRVTRR